MSDHRHVREPGETIQLPRPSWGPALFAIGAIGAVAGIYANGFVFSAFIWSYVGIVILLFGFRAIVRTSVRSYFSLPRRQHPHNSTLPIDQIRLDASPTTTSSAASSPPRP